MYGVSNATLWSNNPQIDNDCSNIYVGEVLCVDTNDFSYPTYNESLYQVSLSSLSLISIPLVYVFPTGTKSCFSTKQMTLEQLSPTPYPLPKSSPEPDLTRHHFNPDTTLTPPRLSPRPTSLGALRWCTSTIQQHSLRRETRPIPLCTASLPLFRYASEGLT